MQQLLAAGGKLTGDAGDMLGADPRSKRTVGEGSEQLTAAEKKAREQAQKWRDKNNGLTSDPPAADSDTTSDTSGTDDSTTPGVSPDISAQHTGKGTLSKAEIKQMALDVGFNPEAASTVVGIAGGESGFDPTNSTVRSGLHAKTGEDSVGLMQINWGYHKDSGWLQKLGITKREQLFDPVTNLKAAKYLYDGRGGGFQDWTVFNKGIYKDYL